MAISEVTATVGWPDTPQFTAGVDTSCMIRNPNDENVFYVVTNTATKPTISEDRAPRLWPDYSEKSQEDMLLKNGENLWIATVGQSVLVTLMTGAG